MQEPAGSPPCSIEVVDRAGVPARLVSGLVEWLRPIVAELAAGAVSLDLCLAGDDEVRRVNAEYRGIDSSTDVLSFAGGATPEGDHLGDVLIAWPTALRQAEAAGHSIERELRELALHGVLHCLGYDHETDDGAMQRLELTLRERWLEEGAGPC